MVYLTHVDVRPWADLVACVAEILVESLVEHFELTAEDGDSLSCPLHTFVGRSLQVEVALLGREGPLMLQIPSSRVVGEHIVI